MFSSVTILYARRRLFVCQCFRSEVTFVSLCVPNASVDSITRRGTARMLREAFLCFTWSHARALIAETQHFDGRLLVFGVNAAPETEGSDVRFLR